MNRRIELFDLLTQKYHYEHQFSSFVNREDVSFRCIVKWGKIESDNVIPLLLKIIDEDWAWPIALWEIVGENNGPFIAAEDAGRHDVIVSAWLEWGKVKGYN